jgi:hypothetical protein
MKKIKIDRFSFDNASLDFEQASFIWLHCYDELCFEKIENEDNKKSIENKINQKISDGSFIECRIFNSDIEDRFLLCENSELNKIEPEKKNNPFLEKIQIVNCKFVDCEKTVELKVREILDADADGQYHVIDRVMAGVNEIG